MKKGSLLSSEQSLLKDLSLLIEQSQQQVVTHANSTITMLFWHVGNRVNQVILQNKRADYGKRIVSTVSTQLKAQSISSIFPNLFRTVFRTFFRTRTYILQRYDHFKHISFYPTMTFEFEDKPSGFVVTLGLPNRK